MSVSSTLQGRFRFISATLFAMFLAGFLTPRVGAQEKLKFEPRVVIREPFPAIVLPPSVSAEEAQEALHLEELVLGVEINGSARAYPINMLNGPRREIINDKLGGQAIAATW